MKSERFISPCAVIDSALVKKVDGFTANLSKFVFKSMFVLFLRTPYQLAKISASFTPLMALYHAKAAASAGYKGRVSRLESEKRIATLKEDYDKAVAKGDAETAAKLDKQIAESPDPFNNFYEQYPDFVLNSAKSIIGIAAMLLMRSVSEGDDDDDKKKLLFISSRLPSRGDSGENLVRDVMTGGSNYYWRVGTQNDNYKVSINGMDPITTTLALMADANRVMKLKNIPMMDRLAKQFGFFSRLMEDKTMIRGLGNLSKTAQGDMNLSDFMQSYAAGFSPNFFKGIARAYDPLAREFGTGTFTEKLLPYGGDAAKKINLAGEDVEKGGGSAMARYWWDFSNKVGGQPDWLKALGNWNQKMMGQKDSKNESATYGPTIQRNRDFDLKFPNGTVKKVELTTKQVEDYNMQVALMANRMLRPQFSARDVATMTEQKVKVIRDAWSDAKKIAREQLNRRLLSQGAAVK